MKKYLLALYIFNFTTGLWAQLSTAVLTPTGKYRVLYEIEANGDTLLIDYFNAVFIADDKSFDSEKAKRQWTKLKRDVAIAYPYAKQAGIRLKAYNDKMIGLPESERSKFLKQAERDIKAEFEEKLKKLTMNQGRILIRLIDRETGSPSYNLVKDLRGSFQAVGWQATAQLFGHDLKSRYAPDEVPEDKAIEQIVRSIENGTFSN